MKISTPRPSSLACDQCFLWSTIWDPKKKWIKNLSHHYSNTHHTHCHGLNYACQRSNSGTHSHVYCLYTSLLKASVGDLYRAIVGADSQKKIWVVYNVFELPMGLATSQLNPVYWDSSWVLCKAGWFSMLDDDNKLLQLWQFLSIKKKSIHKRTSIVCNLYFNNFWNVD